MKILSCYIDNFGKLHNMKCSLKDGFNMMNADNGWGKSTFGAFIRTMFYGMNQKKSGAKFDKWDYRRNYQPWQGGKFGGCITFEYKNKEYRLERYFGSKISEDTFSLIDLKTMQVSNDFGPQIGQEIFGIDGEGFERSAYIPQNELFIEANDSINNRLLGLVEDENDMSRFSVAIKALDKARRELVKTGGRGKIDLTQNRIDEAKTNILQNQKIAEKEQEISTRYEEAKAQKAEAWKRLEDSGKVLDELNEKGVSRGKKTAYLSLGIIFLIFALLAVVTSQSFVFYFGNIYKSVAFYCMIAAVIFAVAAILFIILRLRLGGDQSEKIKEATAQTVEAREAYTLAEQKEKELFEQLEETGKLVEQNMENTHEVAAMEETQKIDRERLDIINKTKMYLEKAKQELSVHYLDKMRRYFDKYIDQVIGDANVKMDSEFRIMIEKEGSYRSSKNQSTGIQDILNLCARFALVESLYEEEKPCIILDDVMNNMDDDNSDKMMKAIESLSENYQVIYLTCHTSRVIKKIKETEKNG